MEFLLCWAVYLLGNRLHPSQCRSCRGSVTRLQSRQSALGRWSSSSRVWSADRLSYSAPSPHSHWWNSAVAPHQAPSGVPTCPPAFPELHSARACTVLPCTSATQHPGKDSRKPWILFPVKLPLLGTLPQTAAGHVAEMQFLFPPSTPLTAALWLHVFGSQIRKCLQRENGAI